MIDRILFATLVAGTSAVTTARYEGKECVGTLSKETSVCPELVLRSNTTSFDVDIYTDYCGDSCTTTCTQGFTEQSNLVGDCSPEKGLWNRNTKTAPDCKDQADFSVTHTLSTECIEQLTLVSIQDNMFVVIPVFGVSDEQAIRLQGYHCPGLDDHSAVLRSTVSCTAYAFGLTSLTTFENTRDIEFTPTPSGEGANATFVEVGDELIKVKFAYQLGPHPVDEVVLQYKLYDTSGRVVGSSSDHIGSGITTLPTLPATSDSVGECADKGTHHVCSVMMSDSLGPVAGDPTAFDIKVTDYKPLPGCSVTASAKYGLTAGGFLFNVTRSGEECDGTQNAVVNILVNGEQITSSDGVKEGIIITDESTPVPAPITQAPPALVGYTNALYRDGNTKWGCQTTGEYLNTSCKPIVRQGSGSKILIELYKDQCPPDASCQISCPGGSTTVTVLQGPCTGATIPWGMASRVKPCDPGQPPQPDFITGNINTAGCITQWRLTDSFGGLIMFDDYDVSSSETVKLGLIDCPGIDNAPLRTVVKCTAYSWGDTQLSSFDSSQFRNITMEPSSGGVASNPQIVALDGIRIKLEFDYTLPVLPTSEPTVFSYAVHYHKNGKDSVYPTISKTLSTLPHRTLPTIAPGLESTIKCENTSDENPFVNFQHTCTVVTLDDLGPLNVESLTDFNLTLEVGDHPLCVPMISNYYDIVPGSFKFNVTRTGNVCNGDVMTIVEMKIGDEYITTWNNGGKMRGPVVIDDSGPPVPETPAPPTEAPATGAPYTHSPPTSPPSKSNKAEMVYGTLAIITGILFIMALTYLLVRNRQKQIAGTFSIIGNAENGGAGESWQGTVPIYEDEGPSTQLQDFGPSAGAEEGGYIAPGSLADDGPLILNEATNQNIQDGNDYTVAE